MQTSQVQMVPDQYGYLHVFWSETESGIENARSSSILYTRFNGAFWEDPVDIYFMTRPGSINSLAVDIDRHGTLHLIWTEGNQGPVYYSSAPAYEALSARAWETPVSVEIPAFLVTLKIDAEDMLHVAFIDFYGPEPGVYYTRSRIGSFSWSDPTWLDPDIPLNEAPQVLRFELDQRGGLHAAWHYIILDTESVLGQWVRYTHSLDGGNTWSPAYTIDIVDDEDDPGELRLPNPGMAVAGDQVHVIWAGTSNTNREHIVSLDRGQTWSEPKRVFGNLGGQAIGDGIAVDAADRLHFIGQIRWPQGLYHVVWDQDHWSEPTLAYLIAWDAFDERDGRYHAHNVRAAVRAGNQLVVAFTDEAVGPLYVMYRTLEDVSPLSPLPTPEPTVTLQPSPTATIARVTPPPHPFSADSDLAQTASADPARLLWAGAWPPIILISIVVGVWLLRKRE